MDGISYFNFFASVFVFGGEGGREGGGRGPTVSALAWGDGEGDWCGLFFPSFFFSFIFFFLRWGGGVVALGPLGISERQMAGAVAVE